MDIEAGRPYGIVSGDIVGSSRLDKADRSALFERMSDASDELRSWLGDAIPLPVDVFSGDSWQLLVSAPERTLAAAVFFRAHLRASGLKADTRFAVAVGPIDFVPRDQVSEGDGEAFRLSGRLLQEGLGKRRMGFATADESRATSWDLALELLDAIVTRTWTEKRSRAVLGAIRGWTQEDIGTLWDPPIDQATVHRHLQGASWAAVRRGIDEFEDAWKNSA